MDRFVVDNRQQYHALKRDAHFLARQRNWRRTAEILGERSTQEIAEILAGSARPLHVLELGCGQGRTLRDLGRIYPSHQYYGVDLLFDFIFSPPQNIVYIQSDAQFLPFPNNSFDLVYSVMMMPYVTDKLQVVKETHRVLDERGKGYLSNAYLCFLDLVGDQGREHLHTEKDIEWGADGRVQVAKGHSPELFSQWNYLCRENAGLAGMVKSIYLRRERG